MSDGRLPAELWIMAHVRRCMAEAVPVYVARRGDAGGGAVLLKINQREAGCRVLTQTRDAAGGSAWFGAFDNRPVAESEADAYIDRATARDPDLWVVEIEHRDGWHPFPGPTL